MNRLQTQKSTVQAKPPIHRKFSHVKAAAQASGTSEAGRLVAAKQAWAQPVSQQNQAKAPLVLQAAAAPQSLVVTSPTPSTMTFEIQLISPETAKLMLFEPAKNRSLKHGMIARFVHDMLQGKWRVTHQGIAFNTKGQLIDGQNRLHAVIKSNVAVWMLVVRGCEDSSMLSLDSGTVRSMPDQMRLNEVALTMPSGAEIPSVACDSQRVTALHNLESQSWKGHKLSPDATIALIQRYNAGLTWARQHFKNGTPKKKPWNNASVVGGLVYAYPFNPLEVDKFVDILIGRKTNVPSDDPAHVLREWLRDFDSSSGEANKVLQLRGTMWALYCHLNHTPINAKKMRAPTLNSPNGIAWTARRFFAKLHNPATTL
jgi:hypothetical protein